MDCMNLIVEKEGGICTITVNRPEVRNAINLATWEEIRWAVEDAAKDEAVQVLVFTGVGDEAFAAGTDVKWLQKRDTLATLEAYTQHLLQDIEDLWKPSIAAINGYALGGGCELALACDIRIASDRAKLGQPEVRLGIIPAAGGTQRLPRVVGEAKAKELIFTGEMIDATEAERIGLVNRIVSHEKLMDVVRDIAGKIMRRGPLAVRLAKVAINAGIQNGSRAGQLCELLGQTVLFGTDDRIEGTTALLEKRQPNFNGR